MLPKIAEGDANKLWIVPSEIGDALKGLSGAFGGFGQGGGQGGLAPTIPGPSLSKENVRREQPPLD